MGYSGKIPESLGNLLGFWRNSCCRDLYSFFISDGQLRIGIRKTVEVEKDWCIFDRFRLTYLGTKDIDVGIKTHPQPLSVK